MYKLIAIDMDGTLLTEEKTISPKTKEVIERASKDGVKVVLASGRPVEGLLRYLDELGLNTDHDYVMSFNGSVVQNVGTREILCKNILSGADLDKLYKLSKEIGVNIHAFIPQGCITPVMNEYTQLEGRINKIPVHEADYSEISMDEEVIKIMFIDPEEVLEAAIPKIPASIYEEYEVVRSAPYFLEFLNKNTGKGKAVSALAEKLGIKQEEVMCIGDANNDLEMIEWAGMGVAMENGFSEVKEKANFVTKSNEEDGVAYAISKFLGYEWN